MDRERNEDTPGLAKSSEDFLEELFQKMQIAETKYGVPVAGKVLELSLNESCVFPWEMLSAAEKFSQGATFEQVLEASIEGILDDDFVEDPHKSVGKIQETTPLVPKQN